MALDRVSVVVFLGLLRPIRSSAGGALRRFVRADGAGIIAHGDVDQPIPPVLAADKATHDNVNTLKRQVGRPTAISMANHRPARPDRHAALAHRAALFAAALAGRLARVMPSPPPATERLPNVVALRSVLTSGAFPATIRTGQIALRSAESCTRG